MKLSLRSKLIDRVTPGLMVRKDRPMAESASALIMPPWTKPALLAISSVAVIWTTATPSSWATSTSPSQAQAGEMVPNRPFGPPFAVSGDGLLLGPVPFRPRHACGGRTRDEPIAVVEDIRLA